MPILAGQPFYDASGNAMTDANGDAIGEPDLPVSLQMGVLTLAGSNPLSDLFDLVENLWNAIQDLTTGALEMQAIRNLQDDMNAFLANGGPDTFTGHDPLSHPSLISAEGIINSIGTPTIEWPTEPPSWYTAPTVPDLSGIPGDVWDEAINAGYMTGETSTIPARQVMQGLHWAAEMYAGYTGVPIPERPYFVYVQDSPLYAASDIGLWNESGIPDQLPILDLSLVQAGDTVLAYLQREYGDFDWTTAGPGSREAGGNVWLSAGLGMGWFRCTLTDADLRVQSVPGQISEINLTVDVPTAPIWPGASGVTYGTPAALVDQAYIQDTMHGVVVEVTTPPTKTGRYNIGGATYDYGVGMVAFETDAGDLEPWQYLGFRSAIYVPKTMLQAAGVRFRVLAGAEGTVTPWTRS